MNYENLIKTIYGVVSFPSNEFLKKEFEKIGEEWYGDFEKIPKKRGFTPNSYSEEIPRNRLHIYGTFDSCKILTIYYRYILVDGYIRTFLLDNPPKRPERRVYQKELKAYDNSLKKFKNRRNEWQSNTEVIVETLNLSKKNASNLRKILRSYNGSNKRNSITRLRNNVREGWPDIVKAVQEVMFNDMNLVMLGCVFYRWKIINEYLMYLCPDENSFLIMEKIHKMLNVIQYTIFTSMLLVLKTIYRKIYNNIRGRPVNVNIESEYEKLLTKKNAFNDFTEVLNIEEYHVVLGFIFTNYEKLVEPVKVPDICTEEYRSKIVDLFNF
jgi:hypothetical protein